MLRRFEEADLEPCVGLFCSTFAQPPWNEAWKPEVVRARLDQIVHTPHFFGAVIGENALQGFALGFSEPWHEGTHYYLKEMCIAHAHQRKGLGTKLMDFLSAELRERDTRRIYLLTAKGDLSESFYAKAGFYTSPKMILMARRSEDVANSSNGNPVTQ
jgi:ribosomal protein S18 acetylase RimI-like enzyme